MERTFYRIVRNAAVLEDDFKPAKALGKPLREASWMRQWAEGVSVSDTFEHAVEQARLYHYRLGHFVVAVQLPAEADVEVEQTGNDPHHYTVYGSPSQLLGFVTDRPRRVDKE